jgi:hypothetical protein
MLARAPGHPETRRRPAGIAPRTSWPIRGSVLRRAGPWHARRVRLLNDLVDVGDPAWPEVAAAVAQAPYPVEILPADPRRGDAELHQVQVTTRSWLGAVVHRTGGLVIDHGWLRVLGSGSESRALVALSRANEGVSGGVLVAQDVLGGQFAWSGDGVEYFAPDSGSWENLGCGYGEWLASMLGGGTTAFYETLRWPGWEREAAACGLDQAINVFPPLWTAEGKNIGAASRRPIPMAEAMCLMTAG